MLFLWIPGNMCSMSKSLTLSRLTSHVVQLVHRKRGLHGTMVLLKYGRAKSL